MLRVIEVNVLEKMIIHLECLHSKTSATYFVLGKKNTILDKPDLLSNLIQRH